VGRIITPHGINGLVQAERISDNPLRFCSGEELFLPEGNSLILEGKPGRHKGRLLLKFKGVDDRNAAEALRGKELFIPEDKLPPLPEGCYYQYQLIGLQVFQGEKNLGSITQVLDYSANDIYVVKTPEGKELLLPALKSVVSNIDLEQGRMEVILPEGLE